MHYFLNDDSEWREAFGDKPAPIKCYECYLDSKVEMDRLRAEVQDEKDRERGLL